MDKCSQCGAPCRYRLVDHQVDVSGIAIHGERKEGRCTKNRSHGPFVLPLDELDFDFRVAVVLARQSVATGAALKRIRLALDMTGRDVAEMFDVALETVSRWETADLKGGRMVLAHLGEALLAIWEQRADPRPRITRVTSRQPSELPQTIVLPKVGIDTGSLTLKTTALDSIGDFTIHELAALVRGQVAAMKADDPRIDGINALVQARALIAKASTRHERRGEPSGLIRRPPVAQGETRSRASARVWTCKHALDCWIRALVDGAEPEPRFDGAMNVLRGGTPESAPGDDYAYLGQLLAPELELESWHSRIPTAAQLKEAFGSAFGLVDLEALVRPSLAKLRKSARLPETTEQQLFEIRGKELKTLARKAVIEAHEKNGGGLAPNDPSRFSFPVPGFNLRASHVGSDSEGIRKHWERYGRN